MLYKRAQEDCFMPFKSAAMTSKYAAGGHQNGRGRPVSQQLVGTAFYHSSSMFLPLEHQGLERPSVAACCSGAGPVAVW